MADNAINVTIGADASPFRRGAQEARDHVDGLVSNLRDFKSEQVSTGRASRFFASEIASIVPGADSAKLSIQELITVGLSGGGMLAAFEGVLFVLKQLKEASDAEEKVLKDIEIDYTKIGNEGQAAYTKIRQGLLGLSPAQIQWARDVDSTHEALDKVRKAIEDAEDGTHPLLDAFAVLNAFVGAGNSGLKTRADLVSALRDREHNLIVQLEELKKVFTETDRAITASTLAQESENVRQKMIGDTAKAWGVYVDDILAGDEKILKDAEKTADEWLAIQKKSVADGAKAWGAYADQIYADDEKQLQQEKEKQDKELRDRVRLAKEKARAEIDAAKEIGLAFGTTFAGILTGQISVAKGFADMAKMTVKAIIDAVIKIIEAYAIQAAAAAAAANAGIPIIGFALMAAAAAAAEGLIMGLLGSLPSAAIGMSYVPADMPVFVHEGERILTKSENQSYGTGGGDIHIHIHGAIDGQSVYRTITTPDFRRALREAQRNGRWD